jgi:hypothetical protein
MLAVPPVMWETNRGGAVDGFVGIRQDLGLTVCNRALVAPAPYTRADA